MSTKANVCVTPTKWLGLLMLWITALTCITYFILAVLIICYVLENTNFLSTFFISLGFNYASYFYFGIWNWLLHSWEGLLFIPMFIKNFPPKYLPLLGRFPLSLILSLLDMGGPTYVEDKAEFELKYPDRIAIDVYRDEKV